MGSFEYRIVRKVYPNTHMDDSIVWHISEIYYDDAGKIVGASDKPIPPMGDSLLDLCADFDLIAKAFNKPVLDYETMKEVKETEYET